MVYASKKVWQAIEKKTEFITSIIASRPRTDTLLGALKKKDCIGRTIIAISKNKYLGEKTIALSRYPNSLIDCIYSSPEITHHRIKNIFDFCGR
jgi:hypothetical protein